MRDTWIGKSAVRAARRNVVGRGILPVPRAKACDGKLLPKLNALAHELFMAWARDAKLCDIERRQSLFQKQRLLVGEHLVAGEGFLVLVAGEEQIRQADAAVGGGGAGGSTDAARALGTGSRAADVGLRFQSYEAEQLDLTIVSHGENEVRGGIEVDRFQAPVAYHFYTRNPYDYLSRQTFQSIRIPAERVLHFMDQERVLQTRGVTQFAPVMQEIRDFDRYKGATLTAMIMEAMLGVVVKRNGNAGWAGAAPLAAAGGNQTSTPAGLLGGDGTPITQMTPGMIAYLQPGEDIAGVNPARPGSQYSAFADVTLRGIGAGVGCSATQLTRHSDGNYSASRQDMLEDIREYGPVQDLLIDTVLRPLYQVFFTLAAVQGRLDDCPEFSLAEFVADPDRFLACEWIPPAVPWIDPEKEANAWSIALKQRLTTREEIAAQNGSRYEHVMGRLNVEKAEAQTQEITLPEDDAERQFLQGLLTAAAGYADSRIDVEHLAERLGVKLKEHSAGIGDQKSAEVQSASAPSPDALGAPDLSGQILEAADKRSAATSGRTDKTTPDLIDVVDPMRSCATCMFWKRGGCQKYSRPSEANQTCGGWRNVLRTRKKIAPRRPPGTMGIDHVGGFAPAGSPSNPAGMNARQAAPGFDPNESRDKDGKFASGGGGTSGGKAPKAAYSGPDHTAAIAARSTGGTVVVNGDELGKTTDKDELRQLARSYAQQHLQGKQFSNAATGVKVGVSGGGVKKIIANTADMRRARIVPAIPAMIERGVPVGSEQKAVAGAKYAAYRRFNVQVKLNGKSESVMFLLGRDHQGHWYYNHDFGAVRVE